MTLTGNGWADPVTGFEVVASGFSVTEGPVIASDGSLYFSDVHDGGVYRLTQTGQVELVLARRRGVGGLCAHADGGVVASGRDISHIGPAGTRTLLAREAFGPVDGVSVGGFNDLCADWLGRVLVGPTRRRHDATPTALMAAGSHAPSELVLVAGPGQFTVLYTDVRGVSNGIAVSPDNSMIYHAESGGRAIRVSRFTEAAKVAPLACWSTEQIAGTPDGVALDEEGYLWVAMHGGGCLARFGPDGSIAETIPVPAQRVTNLCFAGRYLYVTSLDNDLEPRRRGSVFRTEAPVAGAPVPMARI